MQMKTKVVFCILLIFSTQLLSQDFSVGFNYSGLISGKNYESLSFYNLEAEYEFMKDILSAGLSATSTDSRLNNKFIGNSTPREPYETSFKFGIIVKYYPYYYKNGDFTLKAFIGSEIGFYYTSNIKTELNYPSSCESLFSFDQFDKFYSNISLGSIFYPDQILSVIFGIKYQIDNFKTTYEKPNCNYNEENWMLTYSKFTEKVNLNVLVWNIGFRVNF